MCVPGGSVHPGAVAGDHAESGLQGQCGPVAEKRLGCGRLSCSGDGENDVDLFEAADEAYAVANAADVLKAVATGVIGANDEDGVARWLDAHARCAAQTQGGV